MLKIIDKIFKIARGHGAGRHITFKGEAVSMMADFSTKM